MKKNLIAAAAVALLATSAAFAQGVDTLAKIKSAGVVNLGVRESSGLGYTLGGGKYVGFHTEMAERIIDDLKKQLGTPALKTVYQPITSQNRIPLLQNGTIDFECGSTTNNSARQKDVDFAYTTYVEEVRILTKANSGINGIADLKGKTVAVTAGTTNLQVLRKANAEHKWELEMVTPKDHADAFLLVQNDRAAAFGMDDILLFGLISNSRSPADYEVVGQALQVEPYACMVRKDDPKFKALVDGVINDMMKSGAFTKLYDKWFMEPIPPRNQAIGLPMSKELKDNLTAMSDKPAT